MLTDELRKYFSGKIQILKLNKRQNNNKISFWPWLHEGYKKNCIFVLLLISQIIYT